MERRPLFYGAKLVAHAIAVGSGVLLAAALPVGAQTPVPVGGEFQVNTYTASYIQCCFPGVAADADGDFVVVWQTYGLSGTDGDLSVQGRRYASDGTP